MYDINILRQWQFYTSFTFILLVCLITNTSIFLIMRNDVLAEESAFRKEFIEKSETLQFEALVTIIKKDKDIIPGEIKSLIKDAMTKELGERLYLLDIAERMVVMYEHWHGGGKELKELLEEIQNLRRSEITKGEKVNAELNKWSKEKKFIGNLVLNEHLDQMTASGLPPVIYPHWIHRTYFKCKVCHESIFIKIQGANNISHSQMNEGKQCGVCHNDTIAFGANKQCAKCHIAGKPEVERLLDPRHVDHNKIKDVASRLGAEWNIENIPGKAIPLDRFGFIDWIKLGDMRVIKPVASLSKDFKEEIRETAILFEAVSPSTNDVLFDHKVHSWWHNCSTCHPKIFEAELGGNDERMIYNAEGRYCGECHSRVAFTFADCLKCHKVPKGKIPEGAMIRNRRPPEIKDGEVLSQ